MVPTKQAVEECVLVVKRWFDWPPWFYVLQGLIFVAVSLYARTEGTSLWWLALVAAVLSLVVGAARYWNDWRSE